MILQSLYRDRRYSQRVFSRIYQDNAWLAGSGEGSLPETTAPYRDWLQRFLQTKNITSVVDIGCGDWAFSRLIDWTGIDYLGLDVVPDVIAANGRQFGTAHITFQVADALHDSLPLADAVLIKDVLQHWPNSAIAALLPRLHEFKYVVITNDIDERTNVEISLGDHRAVDITQPPFMVPAELALEYGGVFKLQNKAWSKRTYVYQPNQSMP